MPVYMDERIPISPPWLLVSSDSWLRPSDGSPSFLYGVQLLLETELVFGTELNYDCSINIREHIARHLAAVERGDHGSILNADDKGRVAGQHQSVFETFGRRLVDRFIHLG